MAISRGGFPRWRETIPLVGLEGPPGVGKTSVLHVLKSMFRVHQYKRYTTREPRPGENLGDYMFVPLEDFRHLTHVGHFMEGTVKPVEVNGGVYFTACPKKEVWMDPPDGTEMVVALFGKITPTIKENYLPEMTTIYISHPDKEEVKKRLRRRCEEHGQDPELKLERIDLFYHLKFEMLYDHRVFNAGTPEQCAREIAELAGLFDRCLESRDNAGY